MTPRFEIRKGFLSRKTYVVLIDANGEPLMISEHFNTKSSARVNIDAVREAAANAVIHDLTVKR